GMKTLNQASSSLRQIPQLWRTLNLTCSQRAPQMTMQHHPIFDLIPFAGFRQRLIMAINTVPPLVNDDELCLDMMNDGLECWGNSRGRKGGEGVMPWDARSWEAKPWVSVL